MTMTKEKTTIIEPYDDKIAVRPAESTKQSEGGILLPDSAQKKPQEGVVIAVGMGKRLDTGGREPLNSQIGDRVIYSKYGGQEVTIDGEDLVLLTEDNVYARLK